MPKRQVAAAEPSEPRSQRNRRPTRRAIASAQPDSGVNGESVAMEDGSDDEDCDVVMQDEAEPEHETEAEAEPEPVLTPRRRCRPARSNVGETPKSLKTPVKGSVSDMRPAAFTPGRAADRSARRKSARALITRALHDGGSDDEHVGDRLARKIYDSSDEDDEEADDDDHDSIDEEKEEGEEETGEPVTPSKRPRGRQNGSNGTSPMVKKQQKKTTKRKARSPTPPRDLPRHEAYFAQNKPGRPKTSDSTLSSLTLLTHDEFFALTRGARDRHAPDIAFLTDLHAECFPQWRFELAQGFSVCLYGLGSKQELLQRFAAALHAQNRNSNNKIKNNHKVVMVNGYAPASSTLREMLAVVAAAVSSPGQQRIPTGPPTTMAHAIASRLSAHTSGNTSMTLTLAINSIDAPALRKPSAQAVLAQLASHPQVHLVCTADTPDFPLLWDMGLRSAFNFVFHDCTTFAPFGGAEMDVVDTVHELLGRQTQRANGREGVAFVLRSLTENAKNLFRLLVGEVLVAMEDGDGAGDGEDAAGLEYRMVYNKAVEEFICSSEMAFRTLLKEFHDHQMITSRKDALGTELLSLPFRREDLEAILEDLSV